MSLDFAVLADTGHPLREVSIGLEFHDCLISEAIKARLSLVLRMSEYYEDARYDISELEALSAELSVLTETRPGDQDFTSRVCQLKEVVEGARLGSLRVMAIAD